MQRIFGRKDKLNCTMKTCIVPMATVNIILDEGCTYKIDHNVTVARPRPLILVSLLSYLICIFMNFNENIKNG